MDLHSLVQHWPDVQRTSYSLRVTPNAVSGLIWALQAEFGPEITRIVDQASLKELSTRYSSARFGDGGSQHAHASRLGHCVACESADTQQPSSRAACARVGGWRHTAALVRARAREILFFATATTAVALPLGLVLAWCLVAVVNVQAFGWRLPFYVFPGQLMQVFALALLTAFVASIVPIIRLARTAPAELLKVFANER